MVRTQSKGLSISLPHCGVGVLHDPSNRQVAIWKPCNVYPGSQQNRAWPPTLTSRYFVVPWGRLKGLLHSSTEKNKECNIFGVWHFKTQGMTSSYHYNCKSCYEKNSEQKNIFKGDLLSLYKRFKLHLRGPQNVSLKCQLKTHPRSSISLCYKWSFFWWEQKGIWSDVFRV